jgi:hypothetical protein
VLDHEAGDRKADTCTAKILREKLRASGDLIDAEIERELIARASAGRRRIDVSALIG